MTPRVRYALALAATLAFNLSLVRLLLPERFHFTPEADTASTLNMVEMELAQTPRETADAATAPTATESRPAEELPAMPKLDTAAAPDPLALRLPPATPGEVELNLDFRIPQVAPPAPSRGGLRGGLNHGPLLIEPPDLAAYYPYSARQRGITGVSVVRVSVSAEGAVTAVELLESSPEGVFDDAARRLGRSLRFRPAHLNGKPAAVRTRVKLNWRLD